ncbi:MAG TPA: hypothetical protein VFD58_03965 [Blastocatellia bacterium]|nr:hypothetical protein [Blastocatellia bacterium]
MSHDSLTVCHFVRRKTRRGGSNSIDSSEEILFQSGVSVNQEGSGRMEVRNDTQGHSVFPGEVEKCFTNK